MTGIAGELARLPGLTARLLVLHVPDERSRCRGCTSGGTGLPGASWPCALHFYATAATHLLTATAGQTPSGPRAGVSR